MTSVPAGGIAVDPLLAEARRRARRRLALLAAAAAVAGGVAGGGVLFSGGPRASGPPSLAAVARRATIVEAGLTGGIGWAMNGLGLWLTADGGKTWIASTPPHVRAIGDPVARVAEVQFADRSHGWISSSDTIGGIVPPGGASLRHMEIERTTDGGRTWRWSIPPGCAAACGGARISFLDRLHGYALAWARRAPRLYATADGGAAWTLVSHPPFSGAIRFLDRRHGFGVGDLRAAGRLFRTADGGRTWSEIRLPGAAVTAPSFFGRAGVLPLRLGRRLGIAVSADGGATWRTRRAPPAVALPTQTGSMLFSAGSSEAWVVADRRVLHVTTDGGRSWRLVRPGDLPPGAGIWEIQFTSPHDGWAIVGLRGNGGAALVRTADGGRTWTPLAPPVPRIRPFHPKPVCGSPCRRP